MRSWSTLPPATGLLRGDERRGDAGRHLLAALGREVHLRHGMLPFDRLPALGVQRPAAGPVGRGGVRQFNGIERLVEADDEPVAEVVGHAAAVARGVTRHGSVVDHLHARAAVEGVDHHPALAALGEREAHHGGALRGRHLGHDVVVGQIDRIVIGFRHLGLVREPALARLLVEFVVAAHGHYGELPVVVDPRRGLVGLFQAAERMCAVGIGPSVAHPTGLGRPEVHAPRQGYGRIGVARRECVVGLRAHQRGDMLRRTHRRPLLRRLATGGRSERTGEDPESFHAVRIS